MGGRIAAGLATAALGAGAALALGACGEDREGSVENIGPGTTGTGAVTGVTTGEVTTGATTGTEAVTAPPTTGATTSGADATGGK
jgi:hypothetical protein